MKVDLQEIHTYLQFLLHRPHWALTEKSGMSPKKASPVLQGCGKEIGASAGNIRNRTLILLLYLPTEQKLSFKPLRGEQHTLSPLRHGRKPTPAEGRK